MKANKVKVLSIVGLTIGVFAVQTLSASEFQTYKNTFSSVPVLDLPNKAASVVATANEKDQAKTTISVVKAAMAVNPAAASAVVAAISRSTPSMAATAAAMAAVLKPQDSALIAKAAATAAPKQAAAIAAKVSKEAPAYYGSIAIAVSQAVPSSSTDIVLAVSSVAPKAARETLTTSVATANGPVSVPSMMTKAGYQAPAPNIDGPALTTVAPSGTKNADDGLPVTGPRGYSAP